MTINNFDKILAISKWEIPYLNKIKAREEKIVYIPNGIPEEFFKQKKNKEEDKILFLGRVSPKKKIETLIKAIPFLKHKIKVEIVGPQEQGYSDFLKKLVKKLNLSESVRFLEPIYDVREKIKKIDSAKIFVLPSRVEGMPQSLIEAMARRKIVIGSDSVAIRDLIKNKENGYLFEFDNHRDLARVIELSLSEDSEELRKNAERSVAEFNWEKVIGKIEKELS